MSFGNEPARPSVAIVTGASRGIGRAIAVELSSRGLSVVAAARSREGLEGTLELMNAARPNDTVRHLAIAADLTEEREVERVFAAAVEAYGSVDALVNNVGYVEPVGILELTLDNWNTTFAANLTTTFLCTREFVRMRKHLGGRIVNIASTAGMTPRPGWSAYAAAKAGVISFSRTMAEELKPYGIRVYCVAPGRTATDLRRRLAPDEDQTEILQPDAVARFVGFLITGAESEFIDGQAIVIRKPIL